MNYFQNNFLIRVVLALIFISFLSCSSEPPPEVPFVPAPKKLPVNIAQWDSLQIKTIRLNLKEELFYQEGGTNKKLNLEQSELEDYLVFIFSKLGIQIVAAAADPADCSLTAHFKGTALPWNPSSYALYRGGKGELKLTLTSGSYKPIKVTVKKDIPVPDDFFYQTTEEHIKELHEPENYPFDILWKKGFNDFIKETFGRPLTIYSEVYGNYKNENSGWGISAKPYDPTEDNFNSLLTLINDEQVNRPGWMILNLERSFPDRMNDEVIPYLCQITRDNPGKYLNSRIIEIMSNYSISQKYYVIPTFIEGLVSDKKYIQDAIHSALMEVSSNDYGTDTLKWNNWWKKYHSRIIKVKH